MLERTGAIRNEVLEPVTFVLAYPTVPATYTEAKKKRNIQHIALNRDNDVSTSET
jgi:hypothetical protein